MSDCYIGGMHEDHCMFRTVNCIWPFQLTEKYEETVKDKESLSTRLIQGEIEKKDAIMFKEKSDKKIKEMARVCIMQTHVTLAWKTVNYPCSGA